MPNKFVEIIEANEAKLPNKTEFETIDADNTKLKDNNGSEFTIHKNALTDIIPTIREETGTGYIRSSIVSPNGIYLQDVWEFDTDILNSTEIPLNLLPEGNYNFEVFSKTPTVAKFLNLPGYNGREVNVNGLAFNGNAVVGVVNNTSTNADAFITTMQLTTNGQYIHSIYNRLTPEPTERYDAYGNNKRIGNPPTGFVFRLSRK